MSAVVARLEVEAYDNGQMRVTTWFVGDESPKVRLTDSGTAIHDDLAVPDDYASMWWQVAEHRPRGGLGRFSFFVGFGDQLLGEFIALFDRLKGDHPA